MAYAEIFEKVTQVDFDYGGGQVSLQTGRIARQADGAVMATQGGTRVLATVVARKQANPGQDFFPLTVNYQERMYAGGRIPGSFFRREGRPTEKETLTSRLIDRPVRPLFPAGFRNEVQVVVTTLSTDRQRDPDILGMIAASAALSISGVPFDGPLGAARVGVVDSAYVLNPDNEQTEKSVLNMVVAGTEKAVLMVESEAAALSEDRMLGAVLFAHERMQVAVTAIKQLCEQAGKARWEMEPPADISELVKSVGEVLGNGLEEAYSISDKQERYQNVDGLLAKCLESLVREDDPDWSAASVTTAFRKLEKTMVRERILDGKPRIDGRNLDQVRPIDVEVGVLPGAHGSALFTRGETQALVTATVASDRSSQLVETLEGVSHGKFMLHYNFPPFSVGETGFMGGPKRREIGHGRLAARSLAAVLPSEEAFDYTIRVVSEITESNGSSSMASVCGGSMAMMDAGIPTSAPVAGVAMGLVLEGTRFAVLTDILGDEDHLGDMDFKVAGTAAGVTALQMDIKVQGISGEIMEQALAQAKVARLHVLGEMAQAIENPRPELPPHAPRADVIQVPSDKIGDVIGKGGSNIRAIQSATGAEIDISDDGTIKVYSDTPEARKEAVRLIEQSTAEAEEGAIYEGTVERIMDFGAFVNILPGQDGLVHISEISPQRVERVEDHLNIGDRVQVKVLEVDERGRVRLSMRALHPDYKEEDRRSTRRPPRGGSDGGRPPRREGRDDGGRPPRRDDGGRPPRRDDGGRPPRREGGRDGGRDGGREGRGGPPRRRS